MADLVQVVPQSVTSTSASIWLGWWLKNPNPFSDLQLYCRHPSRRPIVQNIGSWSEVGVGASSAAFKLRYKKIPIYDLDPNTPYSLQVYRRQDRSLCGSGRFETLPSSLAPISSGTRVNNRPFTVLLGSCFDYRKESGNPHTKIAYNKLYSSIPNRPHIKILVGDQVYLDQPWNDFIIQEDMDWVRAKIHDTYQGSWSQLDSMLSKGGNIFTPDDHEFWNNYPSRPGPHLPALRADRNYRSSWKKCAENHFNAIQGGLPISSFSIGEELSFFVVDTRSNRNAIPQNFMSESDLHILYEWIKNLNSPGIIVLGQPLFSRAVGKFDLGVTEFIADHNLPAFDQYWQLLRAISISKNDLVVLSGDVHFGRIAKCNITTLGETRSRSSRSPKLVEIISSPMSLVDRKAQSIPSDNSPRHFPDVRHPLFPTGNIKQSEITYEKEVRSRASNRKATSEHFMTIAFSRGTAAGRVRMVVKAWLIRKNVDSPGLPLRDWIWSTELQTGMPATIPMPPRPIGLPR